MKFFASFLLALAMIVMPSCKKAAEQTEETAEPEVKNMLVCYFSATGVTKAQGERIAAIANNNLFEIVPEAIYTQEDLDYTNAQSRSSVEMNDSTSRPALANNTEVVASYDVVFIGYPIWWNQAPRVINTFIEANPSLKEKTIVLFATSGGSDIQNSVETLKATYPELNIVAGIMPANMDDEALNACVESLK